MNATMPLPSSHNNTQSSTITHDDCINNTKLMDDDVVMPIVGHDEKEVSIEVDDISAKEGEVTRSNTDDDVVDVVVVEKTILIVPTAAVVWRRKPRLATSILHHLLQPRVTSNVELMQKESHRRIATSAV